MVQALVLPLVLVHSLMAADILDTLRTKLARAKGCETTQAALQYLSALEVEQFRLIADAALAGEDCRPIASVVYALKEKQPGEMPRYRDALLAVYKRDRWGTPLRELALSLHLALLPDLDGQSLQQLLEYYQSEQVKGLRYLLIAEINRCLFKTADGEEDLQRLESMAQIIRTSIETHKATGIDLLPLVRDQFSSYVKARRDDQESIIEVRRAGWRRTYQTAGIIVFVLFVFYFVFWNPFSKLRL